MNLDFWQKRIIILNGFLVRSKQNPLSEEEATTMKQAWEDCYNESSIVDPAEAHRLLAKLILRMKEELERIGRVYHGRVPKS